MPTSRLKRYLQPSFGANGARTVSQVALQDEDKSPLLPRLTTFDLIHVALPLTLNDVEPGESIVAAGLKGVGSEASDILLRSLAAATLPSATAVIYAQVERPNQDLRPSGEGFDGWVYLTLAHLAAGVPTVVLADATKAWPAFYENLGSLSVAEAARAARLAAKVLGDAGVLGKDEKAVAKAELPKAVDAAEDAKADQDFDLAGGLYRKALYDARLLQDQEAEQTVLKGLVQVLAQKRDFKSALPYQLSLVAQLNQAPQKSPEAKGQYGQTLIEAASIAVRASDGPAARELLTKAETLFQASGQKDQLAKVWQYRAIQFENEHLYDETLKAYAEAYDLYAQVKPEEAANQLLNTGNVYSRDLSDSLKALEFYTKAAEALKGLNKKELYLSVLIDKSNTQMTIGDLEAATALLEHDILPEIDRAKQTVLWVRASQLLTNAYYLGGLFQEAKERNEQTMAAAVLVPVKTTKAALTADAIGMKAMIAGKLGLYQEAFSGFQEAIKLAQEYKLQSQLAIFYNNYGFWAREYGAVDQSIDFFTAALKIDTGLKSRSAIAYDNRNMGLSIILKGDFNRAKDLLRGALAASDEMHLAYNSAFCHFGLGDIALREQHWAEAEAAFRQALAVASKAAMKDFVWRAHAGIAAAEAQLGQLKAAVGEYGEGLRVLEAMSAGLKSAASRSGFISDAGVQQVYSGMISTLTQLGQSEEAWTLSERSRSRAFIDALGNQRRRLKAPSAPQQALQWPAFSKVEVTSLTELGRLLGPKTALVEYQVTATHLLVWLVYDGKISGHAVRVSDKELVAKVREYRELIENYSSTDYLGQELSDLLLKDVLPALDGVKHLVVVPHGPLHVVPFAALPLTPGTAVVDRFAVSYLESATMARFTLNGPPRPFTAQTRILALANPTPTNEDSQPLPFASKEVEVMGRYFSGRDERLGPAATKAAVVAMANKYDVLHIASHAEFIPASPADSHLLLAKGGEPSGDLSVAEVFGLTTTADMVTLSACDSGLGRLSVGDEIVGLNRAFFYAGANTVVSGLWRISDVASAVTMKRFYRYLATGQSRAEAMRQAQLVVRRYFNHPAYWAAFRVVGDGR